ncbi:hypothetical protein Z297_00156 [Streptococcus pyogenes ABC020047619]|nr:hypothetical protein Z297_00156 [Streptococcus pyogenes ABC020047619]
MSRDPTLILDESNLVIGKDGRVHYTFTAEDDNPKVRLASKCLGTAHFNQLMIERGDQATSYVAPVVVEGTGNPTGLFKDLKEISLELTDTANSQLWSKIKLTNRGMLQEYYDGKIKTEIVNSARGVATRISEDTDKKLALINDTIDGIRREYRDADRRLSSSYQSGINGLKAQLANDKIGLQAEIQATAQGLSQKYDNELRQLSAKITTTSSGTTEAYESKLAGLRAEFTRSNQGMRIELESQISGLRAVQQSTASQISQEIRDRFRVMEEVELCDIVPLYYPKFGITTESEKVVEIVYDVYTDSNHTIKLGTIGQSISKSLTGGVSERINALENNQKVITNNQKQFELNLPKYLNDINGKRVWYEKPDDNIEHKIGDYWFEKNGKYQRTWIWDGNQWVKVLDTEDLNPNQRAFDEAMAEIEKAKKAQEEINQRTDKELEEFRATLKNLALPEEAIKKITEAIKVDDIPSIKQSFDDLKNKVSETSETSRLNAEILGNNGKTRYNKNLLVGDPNRTKTYDEDYIEVEANDGGFKRGETYTISFSQTCELLQKVAITLTQANNKGVKLVLTPTKAKTDAQTFEVTKDKQSIEVYPLSYTGVLTGDWYKPKQIDLNASDTQELALEMAYKEVVDGKDAAITGIWSDSPQIILDGGKK